MRFLKYNAVAVMGVLLKFVLLTVLVESNAAGYLCATALAVEAAVLHNFVWHLRWTWRDRTDGLNRRDLLARLCRFHLAVGTVAMLANLLLMRVMVGQLGMHYVAAAVLATVSAGIANFLLSNFIVFVRPRTEPCRT